MFTQTRSVLFQNNESQTISKENYEFENFKNKNLLYSNDSSTLKNLFDSSYTMADLTRHKNEFANNKQKSIKRVKFSETRFEYDEQN